MKIVLTLADLFGVGGRPSRSSAMIFFTVWPKDGRARYWVSDIDKVMILAEPSTEHRWYSIRVFEKNGDKQNYTISESTFLDLQNSDLDIVRSPRAGPWVVKKAT